MVDQLGAFASEVTRVAREVGTEGKLGGQADVQGVSGTWKDLTESVNSMAGNLTAQVRNIAEVTKAVATGDLSRKITVDVKGEILELKNTINTMVDQLRSFAAEVTRVAREVGTDGKLGGQADVPGVAGTWKVLTDSVNSMAGNLTAQVRNIAEVTTAVAMGDLSKKIAVDVKGEILELKNTINTMVDQLRTFAGEVTRVAREVGTEGKLGGQAAVQGVAGTWKDLTDSVNFMAANLTDQVRGIARVVTAVANGDLKHKLTVEAKGEIAALADTINGMTDTLATFADQVTTVAREVGVEGRLGGQAKVPGAAGTWKALTENVNQLADNLTTQVRAIADVAVAVTKGDLTTRSITVDAQGEVAVLKDTINEMISNLRDTTLKNTEQDWLKTNLAKFNRLLQGQKDVVTVAQTILSELAPVVGAQQAELYVREIREDTEPRLTLLASYASDGKGVHGKTVELGEGLIGQVALTRKKVLLENLASRAVRVVTGLSEWTPSNILVLPIVFEDETKGVLELASIEPFSPSHQALLDQVTESIGIVINTIKANMRTEELLKQSQSLANELQRRQEELQRTNEELQDKAMLLAQRNEEVERKNREVEQARQALEDKAMQLDRSSKYKSEFLANMSHELRTPLNSLLILSDQLCQNRDNNLTPRQVNFAKTIHSSGKDLLTLINDILDLSKIGSGTVAVDVSEVRFDDLSRYFDRTFRHVADDRGLEFQVRVDPRLPKAMTTDAKRLQQILKNLVSNALKFTHQGGVTLTIEAAGGGWSHANEVLNSAAEVVAFQVTDTGIGISSDKQQIIFEAFHQADGSISRKYAGTGLGLAISRELSRLLGGEIGLVSTPGQGSRFTLYLPADYTPPRLPRSSPAAGAAELGGAGLDGDGTRSESGVPQAAADVLAEEQTEPTLLVNEALDDRHNIQPGDTVLLIVENDLTFARLLLEAAHEKGCKGLVTSQGAGALVLARDHTPDLITLDIVLPDVDGWRVLNRLKNDLSMRHIPVCVISTEDARERAFEAGARAFIPKPIPSKAVLDAGLEHMLGAVRRPKRRIVAIGGGAGALDAVIDDIDGDDLAVAVATPGTMLATIADQDPDCVVVDAQAGIDLARIAGMREAGPAFARLPVLAWDCGGQWSDARSAYSFHALTVRHVLSRQRLVDLVAFYAHRRVTDLPEGQLAVLEELHQSDSPLEGRKVLIVDDDSRNIYALTSVLEEHSMMVEAAGNGRDALGKMAAGGIDVVLMDIMMPEMDGIATMREARKICRDLPIIAVTAKAMKGDRERCMEAGAWDYLSKPVDPQHLLAVLRSWLRR
jgi:signal transduction histidine kinase/DNA-binding response OmpR family regulator/HAMP domain-containing protein